MNDISHSSRDDSDTETDATKASAKGNSRKALLFCALISIALIIALPVLTGSTNWLEFEADIVVALVLGMIGTAATSIWLMSLAFRSARTGVDEQPNFVAMMAEADRQAAEREEVDADAAEAKS
ncbi:MAG: hypothetical protein AAGA09_00220 [Pseudomonadota bacterium]